MGTKMDAMEFADRILKCVDCKAEFVFTAGEQLFFYNKQFKNDPKLCKSCKAKRYPATKKNIRETQAVCSGCGAATTVPFKPTQGRPFCAVRVFIRRRWHPLPLQLPGAETPTPRNVAASFSPDVPRFLLCLRLGRSRESGNHAASDSFDERS